MAGYRPSRDIAIAKPCSESWEAMAGDARSRHCESCGKDVLNVASMTAAQLEAVIARPGPMPCMRIVREADGSLMVAQEDARPGMFGRVSMLLSTAMLMSTEVLAQTSSAAKPETVVMVRGYVMDASRAVISHAHVELRDQSDANITAVETDAEGGFLLKVTAGTYTLDVKSPGFKTYVQTGVELSAGEQRPIQQVQLQLSYGDVQTGVCVLPSPDTPVHETPSTTGSLELSKPLAPLAPVANMKKHKKAKPTLR